MSRYEHELSARQRHTALASLERDATLSRIRRARRLVIAGAAGLTAAFAGLASALLPGRSLGASNHATATVASRGTASPSAAPPLPAPAGAAALGLQGPADSPQPATPTPQQVAPSQSSPQPASPSPPSGAVVSGGS